MPLPACAYCQSPGADLFAPNGFPICQRCDSHFRVQVAQQRATAQMAANPLGGGMDLTFASPRKLLAIGGAMMAGAIGLAVLEVAVIGRVHLVMLGALFVGGFGAFARGLQR